MGNSNLCLNNIISNFIFTKIYKSRELIRFHLEWNYLKNIYDIEN